MPQFFISDLHLSDKRPDLIRAFVLLTEQIATVANAELFILGDFYEAWVGDDYQPDWNTPIVAALQKLTQAGVPLYFLHGNRDFLIGERWADAVGAILLTEQHAIECSNKHILVLHGDECCTDDLEYQTFRKMVRNPQWQSNILALPLSQRLAFAEQLRNDSMSAAKEKSQEIMDVSPAAILDLVNKTQVTTLIHGHTHRPYLHCTERYNRLVLGDWDKYIWLALLEDSTLKQFKLPVEEIAQTPTPFWCSLEPEQNLRI